MKSQSIATEILQGLVALVVLVPSVLIVLYEVVNNKPIVIPDVLAGFDGVVITFYFARAGVAQVAQSVVNGTVQGLAANAASSQSPPK